MLIVAGLLAVLVRAADIDVAQAVAQLLVACAGDLDQGFVLLGDSVEALRRGQTRRVRAISKPDRKVLLSET